METLIIHAESDKIEIVKNFLKNIGISFQIEQDETDYLTSTDANKRELLKSIREVEEGKTKKINLDDIWK